MPFSFSYPCLKPWPEILRRLVLHSGLHTPLASRSCCCCLRTRRRRTAHTGRGPCWRRIEGRCRDKFLRHGLGSRYLKWEIIKGYMSTFVHSFNFALCFTYLSGRLFLNRQQRQSRLVSATLQAVNLTQEVVSVALAASIDEKFAASL